MPAVNERIGFKKTGANSTSKLHLMKQQQFNIGKNSFTDLYFMPDSGFKMSKIRHDQ